MKEFSEFDFDIRKKAEEFLMLLKAKIDQTFVIQEDLDAEHLAQFTTVRKRRNVIVKIWRSGKIGVTLEIESVDTWCIPKTTDKSEGTIFMSEFVAIVPEIIQFLEKGIVDWNMFEKGDYADDWPDNPVKE